MLTISNNLITIGVNSHGAELASIICRGREYLWQADPKFWARHSPVLFPFVGSVWQGVYRAKGETFKMGQHGFARDMEFELIDKTDDKISYRLQSNADTRSRYPYDFVLDITYTLIGDRIRVNWHVKNPSYETMPFQIGAHPAFYWPMLDNAAIEKGVDAMEPELAATDLRGYFKIEPATEALPISQVTEGGCIGRESEVKLQDGWLQLDVTTFYHDALVIEDSQVKKVTLCDDERKPYLALEFEAPALGLWSPPGKRAPFVCIEPWYGRADSVGFCSELEQKKWIQMLPPHQSFEVHYDIIIY